MQTCSAGIELLSQENSHSLAHEIRTTSTRFGVFDCMPIGVCILRQDMTVLYWNSSLTLWSGLSQEQVLGQNISQFFPHLGEESYRDSLQQTFAEGQAIVLSCERYPHLIPCHLPDGKLRVQHTTVTAAPNSNKKEFYAVLSIQDVSSLVYP